MAERTPIFMDINDAYSGDELALPYRDIVSEGVRDEGALEVTQTASPSLSVDIAAGAAWILGDTDPDFQPCYRVFNDAVVNKGISPDPSLPRKVLVVAQIADETFTGTGRNWTLVALHGDPDAAPVLPTTPDSALPLAEIDVAAGATSIGTADITDLRKPASLGGALGNWTEFDVVWGATVSAPAIGNGVLSGRYVQLGKTVHFHLFLEAGSTTTYGSGVWHFALPVAPKIQAAFPNPPIGAFYAGDLSGPGRAGGLACLGITDKVLPFIFTDGFVQSNPTPTVPWTWGNGDWLFISGTYEAA